MEVYLNNICSKHMTYFLDLNNFEENRMLLMRKRKLSRDWFNRYINNLALYIEYGFSIVADGNVSGFCGIFDISIDAKNAWIWILIDKKQRRKRIGIAALRKLLFFSFDIYGFKIVYLKVLSNNTPAIDLYKSVGFAVVGKLTDNFVYKNSLVDTLIMELQSIDYSS